MAEPFRVTSTGSISCPAKGIVEIITLQSEAQNSFAILYEGTDSTGRRIFDLSALIRDSNTTPVLNIPYEGGLYAVIAGTGAGLTVTVR